jgi:8-oxo-dGTP pyrophosphatase MutT (NUDIX family)
VVLIRRPETLRAHAGQVACPGGKLHAGESEQAAALRKTQEELGLDPARVEPLGALHDIDTSTGFVITPWVARLDPLALETLTPDPGEVARVFTAPLAALADPERGRLELRPWQTAGGRTYDIPYFQWEGELIWGATGRFLLDLLDLLWPEKRLRERARRPG